MKSALVLVAMFASLSAQARIHVAQASTSTVHDENAVIMVHALQEAGADIAASDVDHALAISKIASQQERLLNEYASVEDDAASLTAHRLLICAKAKVAFFAVGQIGLCTDTQGRPSTLTGVGMGLSAGASAGVVALVYSGPATSSYRGEYTGFAVGASNAAFATAKASILMIKSVPGFVGAEINYLSRESDKATLVEAGLSVGPMIDISTTTLTLK